MINYILQEQIDYQSICSQKKVAFGAFFLIRQNDQTANSTKIIQKFLHIREYDFEDVFRTDTHTHTPVHTHTHTHACTVLLPHYGSLLLAFLHARNLSLSQSLSFTHTHIMILFEVIQHRNFIQKKSKTLSCGYLLEQMWIWIPLKSIGKFWGNFISRIHHNFVSLCFSINR